MSVLLSVTKDVVLTVSDDGVGLPGSVVESGLANMRQRALRHGGSLEVSQPAGGWHRRSLAGPEPPRLSGVARRQPARVDQSVLGWNGGTWVTSGAWLPHGSSGQTS